MKIEDKLLLKELEIKGYLGPGDYEDYMSRVYPPTEQNRKYEEGCGAKVEAQLAFLLSEGYIRRYPNQEEQFLLTPKGRIMNKHRFIWWVYEFKNDIRTIGVSVITALLVSLLTLYLNSKFFRNHPPY